MASEAQNTANRLNAQKSTGPRTPEGKTIASQNSLTHGLSAHQHVISAEDQADFDLHRDQMLAELKPLGPMESMLADRIVSLSWRLKRAVSIQNQAIDVMLNPPPPHPLSTLADSLAFKMNGLPEPESTPPDPSLALGRAFVKDLSNSRVLERLLMYERRIEHSLFKTITELQRLTLIRKMNHPDNPHQDIPHPSEYLAPGSTGGPKTEHPNHPPRATIMQNKPNSQKPKTNLTPCSQRTYAKTTLSADPKNKPNSNRRSLRESSLKPQTGDPIKAKKLEAQRRSPRGSFSESTNRGPISMSLADCRNGGTGYNNVLLRARRGGLRREYPIRGNLSVTGCVGIVARASSPCVGSPHGQDGRATTATHPYNWSNGG